MAIKKPIKPQQDDLAVISDAIRKAAEGRRVVPDSGHSAAITCAHGIQLHKPCPWCPKRSLTLSFPVVEWEGKLWAIVHSYDLSGDLTTFELILSRGRDQYAHMTVTAAEWEEYHKQDWGEFSFTGYVPKPEE